MKKLEVWIKTNDGSEYVLTDDNLSKYYNANRDRNAIWDRLPCAVDLMPAHPVSKPSRMIMTSEKIDIFNDGSCCEVLYDQVSFINVNNIISFDVIEVDDEEE